MSTCRCSRPHPTGRRAAPRPWIVNVLAGAVDLATMPAADDRGRAAHFSPRAPKLRTDQRENFGPMKCIVRVDEVDAAVACANDNVYGLSPSVFGRDTARAITVAWRIESGICHVNGRTVHDKAPVPFGGVRGSCWSRFGGQSGIAEFTDLRWITVQTGARGYPFRGTLSAGVEDQEDPSRD